MSFDRWIGKEDVEYIYMMEYYSVIKRRIWVNDSEIDEPRVCYTEWNKSEREKQISRINAYMWNLEKWYWCTYLQGRNGNTDVENGLVDTVGKGEGGEGGSIKALCMALHLNWITNLPTIWFPS